LEVGFAFPTQTIEVEYPNGPETFASQQ